MFHLPCTFVIQGLPGLAGPKGERGDAGLEGIKGAPGSAGQKGQKGVAVSKHCMLTDLCVEMCASCKHVVKDKCYL